MMMTSTGLDYKICHDKPTQQKNLRKKQNTLEITDMKVNNIND